MSLSAIDSLHSAEVLPSRRNLPQRTVGDELLIHRAETGEVHFLNATAAVIWNCCDGVTPVHRCVEKLREELSVPEGVDLATDLCLALADFRRKGLLDERSDRD